MRILALVIFVVTLPAHASAERFLKREPLMLAPYASVLVKTDACPPGMVMRVRGSIHGRARQRTCIPMEQVLATYDSVL